MAYNDNVAVGIPPPAPVAVSNGYENDTGYDNNSGYDEASVSPKRLPEASNNSYSQPPQPAPAQATTMNNQDNQQVHSFEVQDAKGVPPEQQLQEDAVVSRCLQYFPVRHLNTACGLVFISVSIIDFVLKFDLLDAFINTCLIVAGMVMIAIEWSRMGWNRTIQKRVFKWAKFMERLWGKAFLYFLLSVICMSDTKSIIKVLGGIVVFVSSLYNLFVGILVCRHMKRITEFVLGGSDTEDFENSCVPYIERKFNELDAHNLGKISLTEILQLGLQAGRKLTPTEANTIVRYFDEHLSYEITKEDFVNGIRQFCSERFWSL